MPIRMPTEQLAVVHNGIIENFRELRAELEADGHVFADRDRYRGRRPSRHPRDRAQGPVAGAVGCRACRCCAAPSRSPSCSRGEDDLLIGARRGPPLAVGVGDGEMYLGSDALALAPFTNLIAYLEEGDWVGPQPQAARPSTTKPTRQVERRAATRRRRAFLVEKGNHRHFMAKEIYEQPEVVGHALTQYLDMVAGQDPPALRGRVRLEDAVAPLDLRPAARPIMRVSPPKYWFERLARLPVEIDVASEFRYRETPLTKDGLSLVRLAIGRDRRHVGDACATPAGEQQHVLSVVNVTTSTIARESDVVAPTLAGPEIGVASTKAFTCQLTTLACLAARRCPRPRPISRRG